MAKLISIFLKIFFRNKRAVFFVVFLPAGIFLLLGFLGIEEIIRFELSVSYQDFLLPGIIAFSIMQMGIYTLAYILVDYKRLRILKRLSITPLRAGKFLVSQNLARFVIAMFQVAFLALIGTLVFGTQLGMSILWLPLVVFLGSLIFQAFGFLIASFARDYEEAAPYTTLIGLPLIFLGDVFFFPSKTCQSIYRIWRGICRCSHSLARCAT